MIFIKDFLVFKPFRTGNKIRISFETWSHLGSSFGYDTNRTDNDYAHTDDNHGGNGWHNNV